ncbi:hypothetical protein RCL_jg5391.t1 [Rhizophagus clarus]|uniref:Uncharacterized protein n=1 Tax=Rhizophagus clarus TaxID=94130 RepID=A0A8H3LK68_9GLOM|nr:hypothetical protein RCL_jg5391.t1 [Rhizophagus clarus]
MILASHLVTAFKYFRSSYSKKSEPTKIGCINNASYTPEMAVSQKMDMDISSPDQHQSTPVKPHTIAVISLTQSTLKGKGKKKHKKSITIDNIDEAFQSLVDSDTENTYQVSSSPLLSPSMAATNKVIESSALLLDNHASKKKKLKVQDNKATHIIIEY